MMRTELDVMRNRCDMMTSERDIMRTKCDVISKHDVMTQKVVT